MQYLDQQAVGFLQAALIQSNHITQIRVAVGQLGEDFFDGTEGNGAKGLSLQPCDFLVGHLLFVWVGGWVGKRDRN